MRYLLLLMAVAAWAGTDPKPKAEDYEVHGKAGAVTIGAEYMVTSIGGDGQMFVLDDYLVVEVGLFPRKGDSVVVASGDFSLRVDGRRAIPTSGPQAVIAAIQRRQWQWPTRGVEGAAGVGDKVVILGGPPRSTGPYGQPTPTTPAPPRAPKPENPSGMPTTPKVSMEELVVQAALPEGTYAGAVSGYLYFRFDGKASKIRSVELLYEGTTLKLK